ncbi:MAG: hypothetical protein GXP01_08005 [Alphaproteobacteria bacterium]|nr:hypothetical protein [Alphaproteobacteria bacterium]
MQKYVAGAVALIVLLAPLAVLASDPLEDDGIDVIDPPDVMVQLAWRAPDGQVEIQYTYTAPNGCWSRGETRMGEIVDGQAAITFVPEITDGFCTQVLTPINYSGSFDISAEATTLRVIVEHPLSGIIEQSELWIDPNGKTDTQAEFEAQTQ